VVRVYDAPAFESVVVGAVVVAAVAVVVVAVGVVAAVGRLVAEPVGGGTTEIRCCPKWSQTRYRPDWTRCDRTIYSQTWLPFPILAFRPIL